MAGIRDTNDGKNTNNSNDANYLIIVRFCPNLNTWCVDEDSKHILQDQGGNYQIQELQVQTLRAVR